MNYRPLSAIVCCLLSSCWTAATESNLNATDTQLISTQVQSLNMSENEGLEVESRSVYNRFCDWSFSERDFVFSSPNYPQPYQNNLECVITVRRAQGACRLLLQFEHFHLEQSEGCLADYLDVDGQRLCGTIPPKTTRSVPFSGSNIEIRFHTNAFVADGGFLVRASQIVCGQGDSGASSAVFDQSIIPAKSNFCDKTFSQEDFELTSPGYPQPYPNNVDCLYSIRKSSAEICALHITVVYLDVEVTQNCVSSFIEWNRQRICFPPEINTQIFVFEENIFYVRFRGGFNLRHRLGFRLRVHQQRCGPPGPPNPIPPNPIPPPNPSGICNWMQDVKPGADPLVFELQSPTFPSSYPNNINCVRPVRKVSPAVCALEFTVQSFDVEEGPNCDYDFLSVGGRKFCGRLPKGTNRYFNFFEPELNIVFKSDERGAGCGFSLTFRQRTNCFVPPPIPPLPPIPPAPPGPIIIHRCDVVFTDLSFTIFSPLATVNTRCTYYVKRQPGICALSLHFAEFDFGPGDPACLTSYLEIKGQKLCSRNTVQGSTRSYIFDEDVFTIVFLSGLSHPSFRINALQRACGPGPVPPLPPPSPFCDTCKDQGPSVFLTKQFRLSSPNFPAVYAPDLTCIYKVSRISPNVCQLRIQIVEFDIEDSFNCQKDSLDINGENMCGQKAPGLIRNFEFRLPEMVIRFESDNLVSGRGFLVDATQVDCTLPPRPRPVPPLPPRPFPYVPTPIHPQYFTPLCNRVYHVDDFEVRSEDYPMNGPVTCRYTIYKIHREICIMEVEFKRFQLENTPSCSSDYLDINGQRECGFIAPGSIRRYNFNGNNLDVNIGSGRGFNSPNGLEFRLRQLPCDSAAGNVNEVTVRPPSFTCDVFSDQEQIVWTSPDYPNSYANNQQCTLTIRKNRQNICAVDLRIEAFSLEQSNGCVKDYVEILGQRICGNLSQQLRSIPFDLDELKVKFVSDSDSVGAGFRVSFGQRECDVSGPIFKRLSSTDKQNVTKTDMSDANKIVFP